jgi:hypothetical protein
MPIRRVGPLTTRAGVTFGFRDLKRACTASNTAWSISGGTSTTISSALDFSFPSLSRLLNS